jgi:hypothetical protein
MNRGGVAETSFFILNGKKTFSYRANTEKDSLTAYGKKFNNYFCPIIIRNDCKFGRALGDGYVQNEQTSENS